MVNLNNYSRISQNWSYNECTCICYIKKWSYISQVFSRLTKTYTVCLGVIFCPKKLIFWLLFHYFNRHIWFFSFTVNLTFLLKIKKSILKITSKQAHNILRRELDIFSFSADELQILRTIRSWHHGNLNFWG